MVVGPRFNRNFGGGVRVVLLDVEVDRDVGDARAPCELNVDQVRLVAVRLPQLGEVG